jgi:hypothetical protein
MIKAMIKELDVNEDLNSTQATQKTKFKGIETRNGKFQSATLKAVPQKLGKPTNIKAIKKKPAVSEMKNVKSNSHDLVAEKISKEIESKHQILKEFKRQVYHNKHFIYFFFFELFFT